MANPASFIALAGVLMACVTKSAQFPFHFWLPNAMAGPTPVSALLHSATMVKAGDYLMAMLAPFFVQSGLWMPLLVTLGLLTIFIANFMGMKTNDLKKLFASTTLSALGVLTVLAGIGTADALKAFAIYLCAHALYKAPLFLATGVIESSCGSRDIHEVRGVGRQLPLVGILAGISLISLLGLPPTLGFLGKEYALKTLWMESHKVAIIAVLAFAGSIAVGFRPLAAIFARPPQGQQFKASTPSKLVAVATPVIASLAILLLYPMSSGILQLAASDLSAYASSKYKFWEGFSPALILSICSLVSACLLASAYRSMAKCIPSVADKSYESTINGLVVAAKFVGKHFGDGRLHKQLTIMVGIIMLITLAELLATANSIDLSLNFAELSIFSILLPIVAVTAVFTAVSRRVIHTLVAVGGIGIFMAVIFLWCSAPDLALTQLLAEILVLFLLVGVILKKGKFDTQKRSYSRILVSIGMGLMSTLLVLKAQSFSWSDAASQFYLENSYTGGFGKNVVNVILVDFRAIDTFGEIIVLAIAALGVTATFGATKRRVAIEHLTNTNWMRYLYNILRLLLIPLTLVTLYRGHNAPGGGFIAALLISILIGYGLLVGSKNLKASALRKFSHRSMVLGLFIALISAILPHLLGKELMQGMWLHWGDFHLGTPLLFDLGVFLVVAGFVTKYLRHFIQPFTQYKS